MSMVRYKLGLGIIAVLGLSSTVAFAQENLQNNVNEKILPPTSACGEKVIEKSERLNIGAHIQVHTKLTLPSKIQHIANSAPSLWDITSTGQSSRHLWVRPKKTASYDDKVGVSIVTENGRNYNFVFQAYPSPPDVTCWNIVDNRQGEELAAVSASLQSERASLALERRRVEIARQDTAVRFAEAKAQFSKDTDNIKRQATDQARDAIRAFQYSINTGYDWEYSQTVPTVRVASVYDDGRRTFIRITNDAFGVPAIVALQGGDTVALTFSYDDLIGVFTVQGLYDVMELRAGNEKIKLSRRATLYE